MNTPVKVPTFEMVKEAAQRIKGVAVKTPVLTNEALNAEYEANIFFKCENFQKTGAFKFRGAYNRIRKLTEEKQVTGIIACSSGNHAQAVALIGSMMGIKTYIFSPEDAPEKKMKATEAYGGTVIRYNRYKDNREELAAAFQQKNPGMEIVASSDHPDIVAGQGTTVKELIEEVGELDIILVPISGGGHIAGSCISMQALSPNCKMYGVEPQGCGDAKISLDTGKIAHFGPGPTICDGAQHPHLYPITFAVISKAVSDIFEVEDVDVIPALRFFADQAKMVVEPTACLGLASIMSKRIDIKGKRVGVVVTGGNSDLTKIAKWLA